MAIDLHAAATALASILTPGGTPVGTIASVVTYTPDPPYQGPMPLLCIRPLPLDGAVDWEGARAYKLDATLSCWYLDATSEMQNASVATIEAAMVTNLDVVIATILQNMTLGGAVTSVKAPLRVNGDAEGPYRFVGDAMWVYAELRVPYIGKPQCY